MTKRDALTEIKFITVKQAAEALAVSKRTLYRLIAEGRFPRPIKVGSVSRIRLRDVQEFIDRQQGRFNT